VTTAKDPPSALQPSTEDAAAHRIDLEATAGITRRDFVGGSLV
jgi:hypothetical protein